eukprot:1178361-Prymnesium_polylepis.1
MSHGTRTRAAHSRTRPVPHTPIFLTLKREHASKLGKWHELRGLDEHIHNSREPGTREDNKGLGGNVTKSAW